MEMSDFRNFKIFILCLIFGSTVALDFRIFLNDRAFDPIDILIPTIHSANEKCKNHSLLYRQELLNFTVWATDMFDASTKFPSGMFIGSIYDTGNFDECIKVRLPENYGFSGQHCMAHFKIRPLDPVSVKKGYVPGYDKYENIFNISTWRKIAKFGQDGSKQARDEMYVTFCIPSSCTYEDLEDSLKQTVEFVRDVLPFTLEINVNEKNCQIEKKLNFSTADLAYMGFVGVFILMGTLCTLYHLTTKLEGLEKYKFLGKTHDILKGFSFSHTIKKLATKSKNEDGIECMNGIKVLSMFLIIMGHRIMFYITSPLANPVFVEDIYKKFEWTLLLNGPIIVDTFFTISGFLACYIILLEIQKRKNMINIGMLYLHRFLRLTPAYAVVLGFYCTIFVQLGEGPFWNERIEVEQERCLESWWANLLYINNYANVDNICMFQSWYLTCDTHYFIMVPFITYLLWKKPKQGIICLCVLILVSLLIPFVIIFIYDEDPLLLLYMKFLRDPTTNHTFKTIYIPSHMRACSYLMGILAGYLKFKLRDSKFKISRQVTYFGWVLSILILAVLFSTSFTFYLPSESRDSLFAALYGSMHHLLWSLCTSWWIIAVSEGCGAWVEPIVTWRPLILLSRITYTSFLCHGAIQLYSAATTRSAIHTGLFMLTSFTASDIVLAYAAGLALTLVFEAPILAIEKIILRKELNKNSEHQKEHKGKLGGLAGVYTIKR